MRSVLAIGAILFTALLMACSPTTAAPAVSGTPKSPEQVQADLAATQAALNTSINATATYAAVTMEAVMVAERGTAQAQSDMTATAVAAPLQTASVEAAELKSVAAIASLAAINEAVANAALARDITRSVATADANGTATTAAEVSANNQLLRDDTERVYARQGARYNGVTVAIVLLLVALALSLLLIAYAATRPYHETSAGVIPGTLTRHRPVPAPAPRAPRITVEQPAAPPPAPSAVLVPIRESLPPMPDGSAFLWSPSRAGKTSLMRAIAKMRGDGARIIDPHYTPGAWPDSAMVINANSPAVVEDYFMWLADELTSRRNARGSGAQLQFPQLTTFMDELTALVDEIDPEILKAWHRVARQGAKYGLFVVIGSQTIRAKVSGMTGETDILQNMRYLFRLGKVAYDYDPTLQTFGNRAAILTDSHAGKTTPVVIPYNAAEDPDSPQYSRQGVENKMWIAPPSAHGLHVPSRDEIQITLPPDPRRDGMQTPSGFVTAEQLARIEEGVQPNLGWSHRQIERHAFGFDGGAAYYMTEHVMRAMGWSLTALLRRGATTTVIDGGFERENDRSTVA